MNSGSASKSDSGASGSGTAAMSRGEHSVPSTSKVAGSSHFKSMVSFGTTQQQIFADIGYHRGQLVALKHIKKEHIQMSRSVLLEFNEVHLLTLSYLRLSGLLVGPAIAGNTK